MSKHPGYSYLICSDCEEDREHHPDCPLSELPTAVQLEAQLAEAKAVLRAVEWAEPRHGSPFCPACRMVRQSGHAPGCRLAKVLGGSA